MTAMTYTCPHCGAASFSSEDVRSLGPAFSVKCRACQRKASISVLSTLLFFTVTFGPSIVLGLLLMAGVGSTQARDVKLLVVLPVIVAGLMFPLATKLYYSKLRLAKR